MSDFSNIKETIERSRIKEAVYERSCLISEAKGMEIDMKQRCADTALQMITDGMIIGLGGGSTVALLIKAMEKQQKKIWAVTPSQDTWELCIRHHIPVLPMEAVGRIDLAFDGCDELDAELNALKSCGGIHTREKIVASMAADYVLLAEEGKWKKQLAFAYPITLEVLRSAVKYVERCLKEMGAEVTLRRSEGKAGWLISDDGNYLMEARFQQVGEVRQLALKLDQIPGVVGHSLFYQIATKAILAKAETVEIIEKEKRKDGNTIGTIGNNACEDSRLSLAFNDE